MLTKLPNQALYNIVQKEKLAIRKVLNNESFLFKGFSKDRLINRINTLELPYKIRDIDHTTIISPIEGKEKYCKVSKVAIAQYLSYKIEFEEDKFMELKKLEDIEDEIVIYKDCLYTNNIALVKSVEASIR